MKFQSRLVKVDPGPDWKGYNLNDQQHGRDISLILGIRLHPKLFLRAGAGYLNYEGVSGFSVFGELEYRLLKGRLSPTFTLRPGYDRIFNQYAGGTAGLLFSPMAGLDFRINKSWGCYLKTGIQLSQQSLLFPVRLGITR
ncbi:MAG: hypothetical protein EOP49_02275 [Sphingobacteriales bacterium]|nr:MAG: hypothetical protein EOP49_02275 [Sphingobacteriales bacterium]